MIYSNLDFAINLSKTKNYAVGEDLRSFAYDNFLKDLRKDVIGKKTNLFHYITTRVFPFLNCDLYLAALDCDHNEKMQEAKQNLENRNISYCVIVSSYESTGKSEHYWIICDYMNNVNKTLDFMQSVPGVDPNYIQCCRKKNKINLRAYPKKFCTPVFLGDFLNDSSTCYFRWLRDLHDYWYSMDMASIIQQQMTGSKSDPRSIGKHFPSSIYNKIQTMYGMQNNMKFQVKHCLYGMEEALTEEELYL